LLCFPTAWLIKKIYTDSKLGNLEKGLAQDKAAPLLDRLIFDKVSHYISFPIFYSEKYGLHDNNVLIIID